MSDLQIDPAKNADTVTKISAFGRVTATKKVAPDETRPIDEASVPWFQRKRKLVPKNRSDLVNREKDRKNLNTTR